MRNFILGFVAASFLFLVGVAVFWQTQTKTTQATLNHIFVEVDDNGLIKINGGNAGTINDTNQFSEMLKQTIQERRTRRAAAKEKGDARSLAQGEFSEDIVLKYPAGLDDEVAVKILEIATSLTKGSISLPAR